MATDSSDTITYGELVDNVLTWLQDICENIGTAYKSTVDEALKANTEFPEYGGTKEVYWEYRYDYRSNKKPHKFDYYKTTYYFTMKVKNSTVIPVVSKDSVKTDLEAFMIEANIIQRKDGIVTTSGLLNFWNNLTCFLYAHLFDVTSNFASKPSLMYWTDPNISYDYHVVNREDLYSTPGQEEIAALDINEMLKTLEETYNPPHRAHIVETINITDDKTDPLETGTKSRTKPRTPATPQGEGEGTGDEDDYQGCTDLNGADPKLHF